MNKLIFNNEDELLELVQEIYPISPDNEFWTKSVQLCIYSFGLAALDMRGGNPTSLPDVLSMLNKAYSNGAHKYLKLFCENEKFSAQHRTYFKKFYGNAEHIITGLVVCAFLELTKYIQNTSKEC